MKNIYKLINIKNIKYVEINIETTPVESYLNKVNHIFVFNMWFFKDCKNLEEIKNQFYQGLREDYIVEGIQIKLFRNKRDIKRGKFINFLRE